MRSALVLFATLVGSARAAPPLELERLLTDVDAHAPRVVVQRAEVAAAEARVDVAGAWEDPTFALMADEWGSDDPMARAMIVLRVQQPLTPIWGRRRLAKESAGAQVEAARATLERARWDARAQAFGAFYELWSNLERARVLERQRVLLVRLRESATARYATGQPEGHHDVLRAAGELAVVLAESASLEDERRATAAMLNVLRGAPPDAEPGEPQLPERRPLPELATLLEAARTRPELAAARAMRRRAEAERGLAEAEWWPMVMVGASYARSSRMPDMYGAELSFTAPVWAWDRQSSMVAMADAMVAVADREVAAMLAMTEADVRMAWSRAAAADRRLEVIETSTIPRLRETVASDESAYGSGTLAFTAVLEGALALRMQELERLRAIVARASAAYELNRVVGHAPSFGAP